MEPKPLTLCMVCVGDVGGVDATTLANGCEVHENGQLAGLAVGCADGESVERKIKRGVGVLNVQRTD